MGNHQKLHIKSFGRISPRSLSHAPITFLLGVIFIKF